jgi:hypothetical protein
MVSTVRAAGAHFLNRPMAFRVGCSGGRRLLRQAGLLCCAWGVCVRASLMSLCWRPVTSKDPSMRPSRLVGCCWRIIA